MSSWVICWEYCCCFWICSASDCIAPSHSAWAPSAPRSILLLAAFLSIMCDLLTNHSLPKPLVCTVEGTPEPGPLEKKITHGSARSLIHPSAWKGYSPKLDFRFAAFSEVLSVLQY